LQDANPVPAARRHLGPKQEKFLRRFEAGHADTYQKEDAALP